ncbi:hypothetical protein L218DRAFT_967898 [Marasmius fiardii PR-910]|nr:hypothetical protein L218DRAFT_967898 [Marasmius fiardii PR-910]
MSDTFMLSVHPIPMNCPPCAPYSRVVSNPASFGDSKNSKKTLRVVVEDLVPITELINPEDLRVAFKDIIKGHQWLVNVARILHREISVNNLSYCQRGDRKCGILKDLDLASTMKEDRQATSKRRTGTKPFIAMNLLTPNKEADARDFARYDLESTVYVFAWIICRYENGQEIEDPPFEEWCHGSWESVRGRKFSWVYSSISKTPPTSQYMPLTQVLIALQEVIPLTTRLLTRLSSMLSILYRLTPNFSSLSLQNDSPAYLDAFLRYSSPTISFCITPVVSQS